MVLGGIGFPVGGTVPEGFRRDAGVLVQKGRVDPASWPPRVWTVMDTRGNIYFDFKLIDAASRPLVKAASESLNYKSEHREFDPRYFDLEVRCSAVAEAVGGRASEHSGSKVFMHSLSDCGEGLEGLQGGVLASTSQKKKKNGKKKKKKNREPLNPSKS